MNQVEYQKRWRAANKEKIAEQRRQYYRDHRQEILEKSAAYYASNRESVSSYRKEWAKKNSDVVRRIKLKHYEANKAKVIARSAEWCKKNRGVMNAALAKRRAKQKLATPAWANQFFIDEVYRLAGLRTKLTGYTWHVDHIVPIKSKTVCGLHVEHNLRVVPAVVNQSKSNRYWPDMPVTPSVKGGGLENKNQCPL